MKILLILLMAIVYAGELEVQGNLSVSEGVTATSFVGDGSGLTNLPSLGGMQPDRIYQKIREYNEYWLLTVPTGKTWIITSSGGEERSVKINGSSEPSQINSPTIFFAGNTIQAHSNWEGAFVLTIYEYNISTSGSDQGMDYIEP